MATTDPTRNLRGRNNGAGNNNDDDEINNLPTEAHYKIRRYTMDINVARAQRRYCRIDWRIPDAFARCDVPYKPVDKTGDGPILVSTEHKDKYSVCNRETFSLRGGNITDDEYPASKADMYCIKNFITACIDDNSKCHDTRKGGSPSDPSTESKSSGGLSLGAIVGIVFAACLVCGIAVAAAFANGRR